MSTHSFPDESCLIGQGEEVSDSTDAPLFPSQTSHPTTTLWCFHLWNRRDPYMTPQLPRARRKPVPKLVHHCSLSGQAQSMRVKNQRPVLHQSLLPDKSFPSPGLFPFCRGGRLDLLPISMTIIKQLWETYYQEMWKHIMKKGAEKIWLNGKILCSCEDVKGPRLICTFNTITIFRKLDDSKIDMEQLHKSNQYNIG